MMRTTPLVLTSVLRLEMVRATKSVVSLPGIKLACEQPAGTTANC
jgi:hypothetical protein